MTTLPEEVRIMAMSALVYVSLKTAKSAAMMAVKQRSRMATTAAVPKKSVLKNCLSCEAWGVAWRACVHVYCHTNAHARGWGGAGCVALGDVCPRETLSPARLLGSDCLLHDVVQLVDRQLSISVPVHALEPIIDGLLERRDDAVAVRVRIQLFDVECHRLHSRRILTVFAAGEGADGAAKKINRLAPDFLEIAFRKRPHNTLLLASLNASCRGDTELTSLL